MATSNRIFLAHAREDKPQVRELYADLKARGFDPWLDSEDLIAGQVWKLEIPNAVKNAGGFLACLSSRSVNKVGYVQNEFHLALSAFDDHPPGSIYLIPVRLDDCDVPDLQIPNRGLSLRDLHWIDLWEEDGLDRLLKALELATGISPSPIVSADIVGERSQTVQSHQDPKIFRDINEPWCPDMVEIPAGSFTMGSPESEYQFHERPQHRVTFAQFFALGRYPLTFEEYDWFTEATHRKRVDDYSWGRGRRPVINVSWYDAQAYVAWLSEKTGEEYRLPSEAEWEYACRARKTTRYFWGDEITPENANYRESGPNKTVEVGTYPANRWGLYDIHGNVWEWVEDVWHDYYEDAPTDGTAWVEDGEQGRRVLRGGSWSSVPGALRSRNRGSYRVGDRNGNGGFRVARALR